MKTNKQNDSNLSKVISDGVTKTLTVDDLSRIQEGLFKTRSYWLNRDNKIANQYSILYSKIGKIILENFS